MHQVLSTISDHIVNHEPQISYSRQCVDISIPPDDLSDDLHPQADNFAAGYHVSKSSLRFPLVHLKTKVGEG